MKKFPITARTKDKNTGEFTPEIKAEINLGENLQELVGQFPDGEALVYNHAKSSMIVAAQGKMRQLMDPEREGGPLDEAAIQKEMLNWEPSMRKPGKTPVDKVKEMMDKMDPAMLRALLAQMKSHGENILEGAGNDDNGDTEQEEEELAAAEEQAKEEARGAAPASQGGIAGRRAAAGQTS